MSQYCKNHEFVIYNQISLCILCGVCEEGDGVQVSYSYKSDTCHYVPRYNSDRPKNFWSFRDYHSLQKPRKKLIPFLLFFYHCESVFDCP